MSSPSIPQDDESSSASKNGTGSTSPYAADEVSVLDGLLILARRKKLIVRTVLFFIVAGFLYAVLTPTEYTSNARVVRETPVEASNLPGGLAALSSGLGLSLGGAASGLTPEAYPSILTSREVRLSVVRDTFYFPEYGKRMTYVEYRNQPAGMAGIILKYTVRLPWTIKKLIAPAPKRPAGTDASGAPVYPTEEEEEAIDDIKGKVSSSVDVESGIMTISFTAGNPGPAAEIAESFLHHLTTRIRMIRTQKSRQTLEFVRERYREAKDELRAAEQDLAEFTDSNQNINSARLRTERDRLERQVRFASSLYSDLQKQLTQAQIEVQRSEPVVTVVEQPVPPMKRSAPKRTLIMVVFTFFGGIVGVLIALLGAYFSTEDTSGPESEKLREIKDRLLPDRLKSIRRRLQI